MRRRPFTLVELLVAMFILSLVMLLVMQFLVMTQRVWRMNASRTGIYENARVAMDLIERDLRSAIASTRPGSQIGFYIADPDSAVASRSLHCTFVASVEPPANADSRLCEISYRHHTDTTTPDPAIPPFTFTRQVTCDNDDTNWDFTGQPLDWHLNNGVDPDLAEFEKVVGGVAEFRMFFYDQNDQLIDRDVDTLVVPARIEVYLLLFDEQLVDAPPEERFKTQRAFTKIIYLGEL